MPEPREPRFAALPVEFDPVERHNAAYVKQLRRDRAVRSAENYPSTAPRTRPRTRDGYPVHVRNGLPFKPYVYQGAGYCLSESEAASCLS